MNNLKYQEVEKNSNFIDYENDMYIETEFLIEGVYKYYILPSGDIVALDNNNYRTVGTLRYRTLNFPNHSTKINSTFLTVSKDNYIFIEGKVKAFILYDLSNQLSKIVDINDNSIIYGKLSTKLVDMLRDFYTKTELEALSTKKTTIASIPKIKPKDAVITEELIVKNEEPLLETMDVIIPKIISVNPIPVSINKPKKKSIFSRLFR